jgi:hypothetical protein
MKGLLSPLNFVNLGLTNRMCGRRAKAQRTLSQGEGPHLSEYKGSNKDSRVDRNYSLRWFVLWRLDTKGF